MKLFIGALLTVATFTMAAEEKISGIPKDIQTHSLNHPNSAARGVTVFTVAGNSHATCLTFWISEADKNTLATILSAKSSGISTDVYVEPTVGAPWHSANLSVCRVNSVIMP